MLNDSGTQYRKYSRTIKRSTLEKFDEQSMPDDRDKAAVKDLSILFQELNKESDRGLALVSAAVLDGRLAEALRSFFCSERPPRKLLDETNAPLGTLSSRVQACYLLGLIDEYEYAEVELVRKVRNEFAHSTHGTSFQTQRIVSLCSSLRSELPPGTDYPANDSRFRFTNAAISLIARLYYRADWVALERRSPKIWVSAEENRWRSVKEEPPPAGVHVIALGKRENR
jgi:hypothetical protein